MPWQNQGGPWGGGGGSGGGGGPWGGGGGGPWGGGNRGGGGGGGPQPPNIEEAIRRIQEKLKGILPGGMGNGPVLMIALAVLLVIWGASGFYRVLPDEQGVVTRFGAYVKTAQPGLNYHLPVPIESVQKPKVTRVNRVEVGLRATGENTRTAGSRDVPEESLMLTGDENIIDVDFSVFWVISDAADFVFNIRRPEETVKAVSESVMREIVGQTPIAVALAEGRGAIELETRDTIQSILDGYSSGIQITQVQMLAVDPPSQVIDSFRDVQRARADQERLRNEAEAYRNDIIPRARGEAERLVQEAEAYKQEIEERAQGDAQRFKDIYAAYSLARDVTVKRLYLETLEEVLMNSNKVILDEDGGGPGVVPYLPLPEIERQRNRSDDTNPTGGSNNR